VRRRLGFVSRDQKGIAMLSLSRLATDSQASRADALMVFPVRMM
jgi:hypothetical protein